MNEKKINYVVREMSPEAADLNYAFDDDGLTEAGGDWNYNLFVVDKDRWGNISGFNSETYNQVRRDAEAIIDAFDQVIGRRSDYAWWTYASYKEAMEQNGIPYNPWKCHALKAWVKDADVAEPDDIAAYLTITTGKKWNCIGVSGYCQGDCVEVVYCEDHYKKESAQYYGEVWLGCAKEFLVIDVENYADGEDGETGYDEMDSCGGYIVADCQARRDEDYKRLVCQWADIPENETVLELIDWNSVHTYTHYGYRIV